MSLGSTGNNNGERNSGEGARERVGGGGRTREGWALGGGGQERGWVDVCCWVKECMIIYFKDY